MNNLENNKILGIPVIQNQQEFIIGVFTIDQILKFTKFTKRLIINYDDENKPIYNSHIQREVENIRVEKIADFLIEDPEATFPTNIVLSIPQKVIDRQIHNNQFIEIYLNQEVFSGIEQEKKKENTGDVHITIIDGQHRIRGIEIAIERLKKDIDIAIQTSRSGTSESIDQKLEYYRTRLKDLLNIQLVVSFFIDKTLEYQAMIFSTINRTQKKVSESLVYSLFGLTTQDSPQKTALQVVLALNAHPKSPFYNRIKLYGGDYEINQSPPLSQAGMVKSIINLISENLRESEMDRYRSRKNLFKRSESSAKNLPMRTYYALNQDSMISDIFFFYFTAVREVFKNKNGESFWDFNPERMKPTNILQTTVGYQALLKILSDILLVLTNEKDKIKKEAYVEFLIKCKNQIDFEDLKRYPFTSKSASLLYYDMSLLIWEPADKHDKRIQKREELLRKD